MGSLCSKNSSANHRPATVSANLYAQVQQVTINNRPNLDAIFPEKPPQEELLKSLENESQFSVDDFYDGIPRYPHPSLKSRSSRVSEVSSRLGRAGSAGLGKAVEVLDTLGSSMTNLNPNSGFATGVASKGNELAILSFEVANTIVKGNSLMTSLSKRSIRHLKEVVLPSEGVQTLISDDMDQLLKVVAADKREELKVFSGEVVRFGNRCKDPQWHSLDRYFEKISRALTPRRQLKEEAESIMELLMTLVQHTAELYHALQVLDRIELQYLGKQQEEDKGDSLSKLRTLLKNQKKQVRNLKKKSLWSRSLEEVMEKLVDIVHFLLLEMHDIFGSADDVATKAYLNNQERLGPAGLSLHYANVVMQIDTLVARSSSMPQSTKDSLYQNLPPSIKSALRSKLQTFHVKQELTITEIKDEMEKTLRWLVPMSTNTAKAHHGFGWVGEWANTGSELNRRPTSATADIIQIDTLHHAYIKRAEAYILELVLWLHHLANKSKNVAVAGVAKKLPTTEKLNQAQKDELPEKLDQPQKAELPEKLNEARNSELANPEDQVLEMSLEKPIPELVRVAT
ncbi:hypothetical protein M5689_018837 [Euphorbia peplus]|nr:hypothetical protein M5689_018837 [Euphorbia peplus]